LRNLSLFCCLGLFAACAEGATNGREATIDKTFARDDGTQTASNGDTDQPSSVSPGDGLGAGDGSATDATGGTTADQGTAAGTDAEMVSGLDNFCSCNGC